MLIRRYPSGLEVHGPTYTEAEKARLREELAQPPVQIMAPSQQAVAEKAKAREEKPQSPEEPSR